MYLVNQVEMTEPITKQIVMGLPQTGKTTFLAALWHVVESGEVPGALQLAEMSPVRKYLNKIRKDWLDYRIVGRNVVNTEEIVSMKLTPHKGGAVTEVFFPDLAGETFELQWKERAWKKSYDELAREARGLLLFVHSENYVQPVGLDTIEALTEAVEEATDDLKNIESDADEDATSSATETPIPWSDEFVPTQVQLVELLQFFTLRSHTYPLSRVAVVVSAWDRVIDVFDDPAEWLTSCLPLLNQFLKANDDTLEYRVYGVSAQGGDITVSEETTRLQEVVQASDRIIVVGPDCTRHDITAPVRWLMNE